MKYTVLFSLLVILIFMASPVSAADECADDWTQRIEEAISGSPPLVLTDKSDKNQLIAHAAIFGKNEVLSFIDDYLEKSYDPVLMALFLSDALEAGRQENKVIERLELFNDKEKDNGLPCFYLSFYYATKSDYELSKQYLCEANKKKSFQYYSDVKKKIVYDYVMENTKNQIYAYCSAAMVFDVDLIMILRRMSAKLIPKTSAELRNEMFKFGITVEEDSDVLIEKIVSIGMQIDCVDEQENPELYSSLGKRHAYFKALPEVQDGKTGEQDLLKYLKSVYQLGEVHALELLISEER